MPSEKKKNQRRSRNSERIELRMRPYQLRHIKQAAEIEGKSVSDFTISSAYAAAVKTIESTSCWVLGERDTEIFVNALLNPAEPNEALKTAIRSYKLRVEST
jgi:uncharacterized protein (DUF1778 family)